MWFADDGIVMLFNQEVWAFTLDRNLQTIYDLHTR